MRRVLSVLGLLIAGAVVVVVASGCATPYPIGSLYTELTLPVDATSNAGPATKVGTAKCTSVLSLVATGDASIEAAAKNGGITQIMSVDWEAKNILGIYGEYTVTVRGK
jgi:hypothetical protein